MNAEYPQLAAEASGVDLFLMGNTRDTKRRSYWRGKNREETKMISVGRHHAVNDRKTGDHDIVTKHQTFFMILRPKIPRECNTVATRPTPTPTPKKTLCLADFLTGESLINL